MPIRQTLIASGQKLDCTVDVETPDRREQICSLCHTRYNGPRMQHQDDFARVMDVSDFLLTEKNVEPFGEFQTAGFVCFSISLFASLSALT